MGLSYAAEKYGLAVDLLAVGHGVLRERLRDAFLYHLTCVRTDRGDLPEGLREEHELLVARVTRCEGPQGRISASLERMGRDELHELARQILSLEYRIRSLYEAPPWHYIGRPTTLIRVAPERPGTPGPITPDPWEN
jgi:hypothetical protein